MFAGFSLVGFIIGVVVAIIFFVVTTAIIHFPHSQLVLGLIALCIILAATFGGVGARFRRGPGPY